MALLVDCHDELRARCPRRDTPSSVVSKTAVCPGSTPSASQAAQLCVVPKARHGVLPKETVMAFLREAEEQ